MILKGTSVLDMTQNLKDPCLLEGEFVLSEDREDLPFSIYHPLGKIDREYKITHNTNILQNRSRWCKEAVIIW